MIKEERAERIVDLKRSVGYLLRVTNTHCLTLMIAIPITKFTLLIAHKMPTLQCRRRCCATTPPCPCSGDINRHPGTYVCVRSICGELIQIVNTNCVWIFPQSILISLRKKNYKFARTSFSLLYFPFFLLSLPNGLAPLSPFTPFSLPSSLLPSFILSLVSLFPIPIIPSLPIESSSFPWCQQRKPLEFVWT